MSDRIYTDIEPLLSIQRGLVVLRDHIRPIEQKFKKVLDEYDSEISETLGTIDNGSDDEIDEEDRLKKLEQKKADLQEKKAACVAYIHAKEEFLRALDAFYSSEGYASDGGLSVLGNSIAALENYLNAGHGGTSIRQQSRSTATRSVAQTPSLTSSATETDDSDGDYSGPVLRKSQSELWVEGNRAIDRRIEVLRDDLKDKGYDDDQIRRIIGERLVQMRQELSGDIEGSYSQQNNIGIDTHSQGRKAR